MSNNMITWGERRFKTYKDGRWKTIPLDKKEFLFQIKGIMKQKMSREELNETLGCLYDTFHEEIYEQGYEDGNKNDVYEDEDDYSLQDDNLFMEPRELRPKEFYDPIEGDPNAPLGPRLVEKPKEP